MKASVLGNLAELYFSGLTLSNNSFSGLIPAALQTRHGLAQHAHVLLEHSMILDHALRLATACRPTCSAIASNPHRLQHGGCWKLALVLYIIAFVLKSLITRSALQH